MAETWGRWVDHDGRRPGLPRPTTVQVERRDGTVETAVYGAGLKIRPCTQCRAKHIERVVALWGWRDRTPCCKDVMRYRLRSNSDAFETLRAAAALTPPKAPA